jgi:hypothetical protein
MIFSDLYRRHQTESAIFIYFAVFNISEGSLFRIFISCLFTTLLYWIIYRKIPYLHFPVYVWRPTGLPADGPVLLVFVWRPTGLPADGPVLLVFVWRPTGLPADGPVLLVFVWRHTALSADGPVLLVFVWRPTGLPADGPVLLFFVWECVHCMPPCHSKYFYCDIISFQCPITEMLYNYCDSNFLLHEVLF